DVGPLRSLDHIGYGRMPPTEHLLHVSFASAERIGLSLLHVSCCVPKNPARPAGIDGKAGARTPRFEPRIPHRFGLKIRYSSPASIAGIARLDSTMQTLPHRGMEAVRADQEIGMQ